MIKRIGIGEMGLGEMGIRRNGSELQLADNK